LAGSVSAQSNPPARRLGPLAATRATRLVGHSRVIVHVVDTASDADVRVVAALAGGTVGRALPLIHSWVVDVPNPALNALANHPLVDRVSLDRPIVGSMERTGATIGATAVRSEFGYDGSGVGVAVIDSGVS